MTYHDGGTALATPSALLAAAELVDDLAGQQRRENMAYRTGYRDGFASGEIIGARRTERELTAVWDRQGEHVHKVNGRPAYAELERIRWDGRREDFGKPRPGEFAGMGADYQPPTYYVPLHPGRASRHREGAA